jgi:N-acetyl-gamma-glutamyl-phosphate reductase
MINVAVLGATGYTGIELVRLLNNHPEVELIYLSSESYSGKKYCEVHPQFYGQVDLLLQPMNVEQIPEATDLVFCALPHGKSAEIVTALRGKNFKVIDLSADFRLQIKEHYRQWYDLEHPNIALLEEAVYGLPELYKHDIANAQLVANPGCYPTAIILSLAPLLKNKMIKNDQIIIDAKSGVSGAGRAPRQAFHFPDCTENFKAYRVAEHQHTPEVEQELGRIAAEIVTVTFVPHLVPMIRGILCTSYVELKDNHTDESELQALYCHFFNKAPFVRVLPGAVLPETRFVRGTNFADLALKLDRRTGRLIIIGAIDNLIKGASGQAVQNMNLMFGLSEESGLAQIAI